MVGVGERRAGMPSPVDAQRFAGYLNDHLGGSEVALKITDRLIEEHGDDDVGVYMRGFHGEIEEARPRSGPRSTSSIRREHPHEERGDRRRTGPWVRDASPVGSAPTLLEDLEALAIGVWGKRLLWGTLARAAVYDPRFRALEIDRLTAQADAEERDLLRLRGDEIDRALQQGESLRDAGAS